MCKGKVAVGIELESPHVDYSAERDVSLVWPLLVEGTPTHSKE